MYSLKWSTVVYQTDKQIWSQVSGLLFEEVIHQFPHLQNGRTIAVLPTLQQRDVCESVL